MIRVRHKRNVIDDVITVLNRIGNLDRSSTTKIADSVRGGFGGNFAKQQAGDGKPWAALKASTRADRARKGFSPARPILKRTGGYERTFTDAGDPDHIEHIERNRQGTTIFVGSKDFRVGIHEEGTGSMSAREVLPLSSAAREKVGSLIESMIDVLVRNGR